jgi:uncharacterized damage-inducible protein DinB
MERPGELESLISHLERYRAVTLQTLDLVPDDKLEWCLEQGLRNVAELFLHVGQVEAFYVTGLFENRWDYAVFAPPSVPLTRASLREALAATRLRTNTALGAVQAADMSAPVSVPGIPVQWPLRSWLWYLVEHEIHHKAQLGLYLWLLGIEAPFFAFPLPPGVRPDKRPMSPEGGRKT